MKAKELDQWFTKPEVVDLCVKAMKDNGLFNPTHKFIEPSAGAGVFLDALASYDVKGYDIDPKRDDIEQRDWLSFEPEFDPCSVVIGNPPYGRKGKLAVAFINQSLRLSPMVAFIVPITLASSWTAQHHVDSDAMLVLEVPLPKDSFTFEGKSKDVPSVFQVWTKRTDSRLVKPETSHPDLEIRIYNKTEGAKKWLKEFDWTVAVKRNSKAPVPETDATKVTEDSHWILIKGPREKLLALDWAHMNDNKLTAGIGRADVIRAYKATIT